MKSFLAIIVIFSILYSTHSQTLPPQWRNVNANFAQIAVAMNFFNDTTGYVGAFVSGPGPFMLQTTNGGYNFTLVDVPPITQAIFVYLSMDFADGDHGLTSGVELLQPASLSMTNGKDWVSSSQKLLNGAINKVQAISANQYALFGTWAYKSSELQQATESGSGIMFTQDSGDTYEFYASDANALPPVSGQFFNDNTAYVIGNAVPAVPEQPENQFNEDPQFFKATRNNFKIRKLMKFINDDMSFPLNETYRSEVWKFQRNTKTWTKLFYEQSVNNSTGYTLDDVYVVDGNTAYLIGTNYTEFGTVAFVDQTTDAGKTWNRVIELPGGLLFKMDCLTPKMCWVAGGASGGGLLGNAIVFKTSDGGATWQSTLVAGQKVFININVISENSIFASAVSAFQTASLYHFGHK